MKKFAILFVLLLTAISLNAQTTHTWTGTTSTDWNTSTNWSTGVVPSSGHNIILNTGSGNQPLMDANHTVANITVSAGTLNLNTFNLTITGTTSLTGGTINNGTATFSNTTTSIAGTTFGAKVDITAGSVNLSNSTFNSKVVVTKTGSSTDGGGGNTFNDTLDIRLQNGNLGMATTGNDIYNDHVYVSNTTSGYITLGAAGTYGCTLATGKKIIIGSGGFNSGSLYLRKLTQNGTTAQSITLGGSSSALIISTGSTFNATLTIQAPSINLASSTFNKKVIITKTGSVNDTQGGNTFNDTLEIRLQNGSIGMAGTGNDTYNGDVYVSNTGAGYIALGTAGSYGCTLATGKKLYIGTALFNSGSLYLRKFTQTGTTAQILTLGGTSTLLTIDNASTFNGVLTVQAPAVSFASSTFNKRVSITKTGSGTDGYGGNTFNDTLEINQQAGNMALANTGNDTYNGDVFLTNSSAGYIALGAFSTYGGTLASGKKLNIGTFNSGSLYLRKFTQSGSTAQSITLGGSSTQFIVNNATAFNGNLTVSAPNVIIEGSTFNGTLTVTKSSSSTNTWTVANTYNGDVSITNTGTGYINPSYTATGGDTYNANATFTKSSSGDILIGGNASTVTFKGNVTLNNISSTQFSGSQLALFTGTASQTLTQSGGALNFAKVTINKASNNLTLGAALNVTSALTLTSGKVITTSTNLLSFANGATVSGASNSSYVQGPVRKTGNAAFTFPTGKSGSYRPIGIAAPTSTATVFTAEYLDANQTLGSTADTSVTNLSDCEHWTLTRSGSSDNVNVTLGWNSVSCNGAVASNMRVAGWNGSSWINYGNGSSTGTSTAGTVTSNTTPTAFNAFTLSNKTCTGLATITPSGATSFCDGGSVTLTANTSKYYRWSNSATTSNITALTTGNYIAILRDSLGCIGRDTVSVIKWPKPIVDAGVDTVIVVGDTIQLNAAVTSGTSPFTYAWTPGTNLSSTTVANPFANPDTLTDYIVTVTDANSCTDKDTLKILIEKLIFTFSTDTLEMGDTLFVTNNSIIYRNDPTFIIDWGTSCSQLDGDTINCTDTIDVNETKYFIYLEDDLFEVGIDYIQPEKRTTNPIYVPFPQQTLNWPRCSCINEDPCDKVCNGGFEDNRELPNGSDGGWFSGYDWLAFLTGTLSGDYPLGGDVNFACPWTNAIKGLNIHNGTADYHHRNGQNFLWMPTLTFPLLYMGYQEGFPNSDGTPSDAYVGMGLEYTSTSDYREYIQQRFEGGKLPDDKKFLCKMYFSLPDQATKGTSLGVYISRQRPNVNVGAGTIQLPNPIPSNSVYRVSDPIIEKQDWVPFWFVFDGNKQKYITIGSFDGYPSQTFTIDPSIQSNIIPEEGGYFLVDNISITEYHDDDVVITASDSYVCPGDAVTLTASSTTQPNGTFFWNTGETGNQITVFPTSNSTYAVELHPEGGGCLLAINKIEIFVEQLPDPPVISPNGPIDICSVDDFTLTVTNPPNIIWESLGYTYQWYLDGNPITGATDITYTGTAIGNYSVVITTPTPYNCEVSSSIDIQIIEIPVPVPTISPINPYYCEGGSVILSVTNYNPNYNYSWYTGGNVLVGSTPSLNVTQSGTYYVVAYSANCSEQSASVIVTEKPLPDVTLTISPDEICVNQSYNALSGVMFSGGSPTSPGTGYYFGPGVLNGLGIAPDIAGIGTHSIGYTYTDVFGCSNTAYDNVTIVGSPTPPYITGSIIICDEADFYSAGSIQANTTYTWTGPDDIVFGTPTVTTPNPGPTSINTTVDWDDVSPQEGAIVLTATNSAGCSSSATIYVNPCCDNADYVYNNPLASELLADGNITGVISGETVITTGNQFSTTKIAINGTLTVDVDIKFYDANVVFGQNAKVEFLDQTSGLFFNATKSWLHACTDKLWDGIFVDFYKDRVIIDGSLVEDARNAVVSIDGGPFLIKGSDFNKNYKGVIVRDYTVGAHQGIIGSTDFTCTSNILSAVPPVEPTSYSPYITRRGIEVDNIASWTLATPVNGGRNTFNGLNYGVWVNAGYVDIFKNDFLNLKTVTQTVNNNGVILNNQVQGGIGIYGEGVPVNNGWSYLKVGSSATDYNTFNDIDNMGIWVKYATSLNAQYNQFEDVDKWAIKATNSFAQLDILHNEITTTGNIGNGIQVINPSVLCFTNINNNIIDFNPTSTQTANNGKGIEIATVNPNYSWGNYFYVNANEIYKARTGISILNVKGVKANYNQISLRAQPSQTNALVTGIILKNAGYAQIAGNTVFNSNNSNVNNNMIGIHSTLNPNALFSCNLVKDIDRGLFYVGDHVQAYLKGNEMKDLNFGLYLKGSTNNPAILGPQGATGQPWDNKWVNSFATSQTMADNSNSGLSKLFVRNTNSVYLPTDNDELNAIDISYSQTSVPFSIEITGGSIYDCPSEGEGTGGGMRLGNIAKDSIVYDEDWETEVKYLDRFALYKAILEDTAGEYTDSIYTNFANGMDSTLIGLDINARMQAYNLAVDVDTAIWNKFIGGTVDTTGKKDEVLFTLNSGRLSTALATFNTMGTGNDLENTARATQIILANSLVRYNSAIGLSYLEFTNNEIDSLAVIAQLCPLTFGPDVYLARAALMGVNDSLYDVYSIFESECEVEEEPEERRSNPDNNTNLPELTATLYPNPTNGNVFILLNAEFEDRLTLRIFDLTGKLIRTEKLVNMLTEVDLVSLSNGMYIYDIYQNTKAIQHGKFIVNK